ncbi:Uncharacterised protein [Starkeya nomas]|uniref:Uncharacterized protein n=1 Tax=Starkeya nomas TaxID=2666134 RepID=A0A5S9NWC8_9HYPH|nr:hypothetical protein [Starkeya nomas]CAA0095048.1 Uncharacterised protein [Starkeya nomas]
MTPAAAIAALNRQLALHGQDAVLRRSTWVGTTKTNFDVDVRITLRGYRPDELLGGITQGDSQVVLGPTEIAVAGWPDSMVDVPRAGDQIIAAGRTRSVIAAAPIHLGGELVRIDMQVRG